MRITLLHPSRGRAVKSAENVLNWRHKANEWGNVEVIVSLDHSDPAHLDYVKEYYKLGLMVNIQVGHNSSVVEATNEAAKSATGEILLYLSDDFDCPYGWDDAIINRFNGEDRPMLLKVDDMLQKFEVPVLTIPIMNQALYKTLGYFWHPAYKSMFVDEDLYWTARKLGALRNAEELKFEHKHVSVGKADNDETYRRSSANWDQGKGVFARRKAAGFPL